MNPRRIILALSMLVAASTCPAQDNASKYGADETYRYLLEIGRIRSVVNTDNREVIPLLVQGRDPASLSDEVKKLKGSMTALDNLDTTNVDPDAVQFKENFKKIVDAYRAAVMDSADLFKAIAAADAKPGSMPLLPRGKLALYLNDTLGAVSSLIDLVGHADSVAVAKASLQPAVDKLHADLDQLKAAKDAHHDFTQKIKTAFGDRYQGTDWTAREILP